MGLFNSPKRNPAPPKVDEPPVKEASPALTRDEVEALVKGAVSETATQLTSVIGELRQGIESLASRGPVVVQQAAPHQIIEQGVTDEEIDNAVASGQGASQVVRRLLDRQARDIKAGLEVRIGELERFGTAAIGGLNVERLQTRKHYGRFKKEIDQKVASLPDAYKANPETLDLIYKSVVGEHSDELEKEAREAAIRQAADGETRPVNEIDVSRGGSKPGLSGAGAGERKSIPNVEDFAGREGMMALQHKERGKDGDSFARSMGYRDWAHYISQYDELRAEQGDS